MFILNVVTMPSLTGAGNGNPSARLAEIRSKIGIAEQRIRELEAILTDLILSTDPDQGPGLDRANEVNFVRHQLYVARAYEGELRTAEQFWSQVVQANKEAEKDTHEHFKKG